MVGGFDAAELGEGIVKHTLRGESHAVEAGDVGLFVVAVAVGRGFELLGGAIPAACHPEVGFEPTVAAEEPLVVNDGIDEGALGGRGGLMLGGEHGFEMGELGGKLVGDDHAGGVESGAERVPAGRGFAFGRARTGGALGVAAVGRDLFFGGHKWKRGSASGTLPRGNSFSGGSVAGDFGDDGGQGGDVVEKVGEKKWIAR